MWIIVIIICLETFQGRVWMPEGAVMQTFVFDGSLPFIFGIILKALIVKGYVT